MAHVLLVGCGGFLGSVIRYLIGSYLSKSLISNIPYPTIIINLLGSFIVGIVLSLINSKTHPMFFYFLIPGFLGGFTTYSAFSTDAVSLIEKQLYVPALTYIFFTLSGGLVLCALGMLAARTFFNQI